MFLPDLSSVATVVALIVGSCLIAHLSSRRTLARANEDARRQLELRLQGLTDAIAVLETRVAELTRRKTEPARASKTAEPTASDLAHPNGSAPPAALQLEEEEVSAETLAMIAGVVTSFLGKPVRIRSAKMLQSPYEIVNPWAQQGRVFVQASHTLRSWGRSDEPRGRTRYGVRS